MGAAKEHRRSGGLEQVQGPRPDRALCRGRGRQGGDERHRAGHDVVHLRSKGTATRAQAAAMLKRTLQQIKYLG
nr:hypothetical protein [Paenibacillus thiaminolyticus]